MLSPKPATDARRTALGAGLCFVLGLLAGELAAQDSADALFELESTETTAPSSADELFGTAPSVSDAAGGAEVFGFLQNELAYGVSGEEHWQKFKNLLEIGARGRFENGMRWVASGRVVVDPVFAFEDFYPRGVREDRAFWGQVRETYVDFAVAGWDIRAGRQQVVWGEMVALFFADVVSARDLREFVLPDFDLLRVPQWAVRAEYFKGDFHGELLWIPYMTYDIIGDPADDFFPFVPPAIPGLRTAVLDDRRPGDELEQQGYGARAGYLIAGWDLNAFYYTAPSLSPAFARSLQRDGVLVFRPEREREHQFGGTLAKDFDWTVLKAEVVHTRNRLFETEDLGDADGIVEQNFINYVVGLEFSWPRETRFSLQGYQFHFLDRAAGITPDVVESGFTVLLATHWFHPDVEPEVIYTRSLNRHESMLQARVSWDFARNWRGIVGADLFEGDPGDVFGRFDRSDRVYSEVRFSF